MKKITVVPYFVFVAYILSAFSVQKDATNSLTVKVTELRNSKGLVQFALYNTPDVFPDEHYEKYYRKEAAKIVNGSSTVTFKNLPPGKYAVNILHDEDADGKIKKGLALPKEGIGFSNYTSIGMFNRPKFAEASFDLKEDKSIQVTIIYLKP